MATGEAPAEVVSVGATETPEIVKKVQEAVRINIKIFLYYLLYFN